MKFTTVAAIAVCATPAVALVGRTSDNTNGHCKKTTVAILGGGMAGVAAAQALKNNSVTDFMILEYQNRLGGRVLHQNFGAKKDGSPYVIEMGANWIQGLGHAGGPENPIYTLAKKYGLKNTYSNYSSILTYNETGFTDYSQLIEEYSTANEKMAAAAGRLLINNEQDQTARAALALAGWNPKHSDMAAQAVEWFNFDWEDAQTPEVSSAIFGAAGANLTFNQFSDENNLVVDPRGYDYIITEEAKTFLRKNDPRVMLNTQVTNISYTDHGVTIHNKDGSCVEAAYAICTFSVGVLQSDTINFSPKLPEWKQTAIEKFSMGTYTKIFLQFNETFWPEDTQYFMYASPTTRGYYPVFQSLSTEGFLPGSNIIFATVVTEESYRIEQQTDKQTKDQVVQVLREMYPNVTIPEPTAFYYPRWTQKPWAFGSYSNWPVGTTLEMHQNLRANADRLWFAGEATSASYFGFLHGAWYEGREAGSQIAGIMQNRCINVYGNGSKPLCGQRTHYEHLKGTSPLENYDLINGWAVSSLTEDEKAGVEARRK
ncbi:hypothetical protein VHEMI08516 [[Torrubiella] hemipterigena]|uniref:Amine oxidase n=1 Tax=[Torrubiella] hemipterigena TaxID=1531966 RepID=A0A0A1TDR3_9HYPO|nr:hypothetical protein VHEMI08516 [[Torrubiella] hemipterigena]